MVVPISNASTRQTEVGAETLHERLVGNWPNLVAFELTLLSSMPYYR